MSTTSKAVEKRQPRGELTRDQQHLVKLEHKAKVLANSGLVPAAFRGKPESLLAVMMSIDDMGMPVTLNTIGLWWVEPKSNVAKPMVQFMVAMAARHGVELWVEDDECDASKAVAYGRRRGQETRKCTYTRKRAEKANLLGKDNWKHHDETMLKWRALGELVRTAYPEVAIGMPAGFLSGEYAVDLDSDAVAVGEVVDVTAESEASDPDIADADIVDEPNDDADPLVAAAWCRAVAVKCSENKLGDEARLAIIRHAVGRDVGSSGEVRRSEKDRVMSTLAAVIDGRLVLVQEGEDGPLKVVEATAA